MDPRPFLLGCEGQTAPSTQIVDLFAAIHIIVAQAQGVSLKSDLLVASSNATTRVGEASSVVTIEVTIEASCREVVLAASWEVAAFIAIRIDFVEIPARIADSTQPY